MTSVSTNLPYRNVINLSRRNYQNYPTILTLLLRSDVSSRNPFKYPPPDAYATAVTIELDVGTDAEVRTLNFTTGKEQLRDLLELVMSETELEVRLTCL